MSNMIYYLELSSLPEDNFVTILSSFINQFDPRIIMFRMDKKDLGWERGKMVYDFLRKIKNYELKGIFNQDEEEIKDDTISWDDNLIQEKLLKTDTKSLLFVH